MDTATLPDESTLGRVSLRVGDLDRLVTFYTDVVGLAVLERTPDHATLGVDGTPLLELSHAPDVPPRARRDAGLFHTAFRVPDRAALGAALTRIEDDWQLLGASDHRVSEALYLRDPEDNGIEIYRDRPRNTWPKSDGRIQMDTLPLDLDALRADASDAETCPPATDVGHVHLEVTDLDAAREFYVDTLGFGVRDVWNGALFVAAGDYHHHAGLNAWHGRSLPASGRGLAWFELVVPDGALGAARDRFEQAGIDVTDCGDGFEVRDGDGIGVRLTTADGR